MAKIIALEWDAREARIAVGSARGNDVVVEQAFAVELEAGASDGVPSLDEIGTQLASVLVERGLTGCDALVAIPRSSIELRTLSLPDAPPEEIPDMVRFQAMQAFTSIGEDWPVDFVELEHDETINVLAAVVSPKLVKETQTVCTASDLKTQGLVLRPFAAVSLLHRFESIDVYRSSLIVDLLPDGADLTAIINGHVVFMRSVRLPTHSDAKAQAAALVGELRRTIGAAQNQMSGSRIEQVIICGGESEHAALRQTVAGALSLDVVAFDPFEAVRVSRQMKTDMPTEAGRFAPLLGMLACQVSGTPHTIDFLNPRQRPTPPSVKRRNLIVAVTVATIALGGSFLFLAKKKSLDEEIATLTRRSTDMVESVEEAKKLVARSDSIQRFERGDITWLDEIREMAKRLPNSDDVILTEVQLATNPDNPEEGRMILKGHVAQTDVIAELEESLRYGDNRVKGFYGTLDTKLRDYPYRIETRVFVPSDTLDNGHSLGRPKLADSAEAAAKPSESAIEETDATIDVTSDDIETDSVTTEDPATDESATDVSATDESATDEATDDTATDEATDDTATDEATDEATDDTVTDDTATDEPATPESTDESTEESLDESTEGSSTEEEGAGSSSTDQPSGDDEPAAQPSGPEETGSKIS